MNCPKCGSQTLPDQKFCRSCGASTQIITQPLSGQAALSDAERTPAIIVKDEKQRRNGLALWAVLIMFIGAAIGITGKTLIHDEVVTVVGALLSLAGMFLVVYPSLSPSPRPKYDSGAASQTGVLTQSKPAKYLPQGSSIEYVPSITERTTSLLKHSAAIRPGRKEDGESQA
ncbi:MAG: zinc-ribbon domain-containing protein [Pyrinomonadaceae bacterium]